MKYPFLFFSLFAFLLFSCGESNKPSSLETQATTEPAANKTIADDIPTGFYVGAFGSNKITICIVKLSGGKVEGYSVVGGNERLFKGEYQHIAGIFQCVAQEPGDDRYDGKFTFAIEQKGKLRGSWEPYDHKQSPKTYQLTKRSFSYDPQAGNYPQSSTQLLTEEDVENLHKEELRMMRNEIYARHGYSFKMKDIRSHFDEQGWYMPMTTDVRSLLTVIERKNDALIKRYETYADEFYDEYGR